MKQFWQIFVAFFRIGALSFGGGYSMLPMLQKETIDKTDWIDEAQLSDYYALAQCEPGLIAVNMAVLICYPLFGFGGAVAAVLGVVTPSLLIILMIAALLGGVSDLAVVSHAFAGIRVAVAALVIQAVIRLLRNGVVDKTTTVIALLSFLLLLVDLVNPIVIILAAAGAGVLCKSLQQRWRQ
ncbi:MAG: chromate transporter [Clostridiales bacterium]